jgi:UDP-glucuronate decarboxylase
MSSKLDTVPKIGDDEIASNSKKLFFNEGNIKRKRLRVLVTGGCGFIGSHLIDRLMNEGCEVICVDNCFSGQKSNIEHWLGHIRFEFIRHDVIDSFKVEVDQIYHLACPASPVFYQENPIKTVKTSVLGTLNMLGLAKRNKARILISSTSEVYGDPEVHPQVEEYWGHVNPIGIRSCYDEGKRIAETLMFEYHRQHKVDIRVARIFNTYGPRMLENDGRVVSNFIVQALRGKPLTIYGDGSQTRSFCYVDDMVDGLMRLMNGDQIGPINLVNPGEYTIKELAETVQEMVDPSATVATKPLPSDDPKQRQPDITKAKKFLGWEPKYPLRAGLEKTIADFRARLIEQGDIKEKA